MLCQSCGRPLAAGSQFCGECGAQVTTASSWNAPAPEALTAPQPAVGDPVLPPSPPLADTLGGPPPPSVVTGTPAAGAATGPPGGGSKRTVVLLAVLGALVIVALLGVGFALARSGGGEEEAAPVTSAPPVPTTSRPPVTEPPATVPAPTTVPPVTDDDPSGEPSGAVSVDTYCAQVDELAALLQEAIDDPFGADVGRITELSTELSETAAALLAEATPEEVERIDECTQRLGTLAVPGG